MSQMNVSVTDRIASYVRKKVRSGRYNNASEVVREALRRMEEEDARDVRLAEPTVEDLLTDLTQQQIDGIRRKVRHAISEIRSGRFREYEGREGLRQLADEIKARGQQRRSVRSARANSRNR